VTLLADIGFCDVAMRDRFDCFRGTSKERVAAKYGVVGVNVYARKTESTLMGLYAGVAIARK
jgi:hypothetical protein